MTCHRLAAAFAPWILQIGWGATCLAQEPPTQPKESQAPAKGARKPVEALPADFVFRVSGGYSEVTDLAPLKSGIPLSAELDVRIYRGLHLSPRYIYILGQQHEGPVQLNLVKITTDYTQKFVGGAIKYQLDRGNYLPTLGVSLGSLNTRTSTTLSSPTLGVLPTTKATRTDFAWGPLLGVEIPVAHDSLYLGIRGEYLLNTGDSPAPSAYFGQFTVAIPFSLGL